MIKPILFSFLVVLGMLGCMVIPKLVDILFLGG